MIRRDGRVLLSNSLGFSSHRLFSLECGDRRGQQSRQLLVLTSLLGELIARDVEGDLQPVGIVFQRRFELGGSTTPQSISAACITGLPQIERCGENTRGIARSSGTRWLGRTVEVSRREHLTDALARDAQAHRCVLDGHGVFHGSRMAPQNYVSNLPMACDLHGPLEGILAYMSESAGILDRVLAAQTANSTLRGDDLRCAGREVAALTARTGDALLAVDDAGERIIGSALLTDDGVRVVDASRRLEHQTVLLVAGYIAGTTGIALKAEMARSLGASRVRAVILGEDCCDIRGCDRVTTLSVRRHLIAL